MKFWEVQKGYLFTIVLPIGAIAIPASLRCCKPNGILMIEMKHATTIANDQSLTKYLRKQTKSRSQSYPRHLYQYHACHSGRCFKKNGLREI